MTFASSGAITAHKADAAATPNDDLAQLALVRTPPQVAPLVAANEHEDEAMSARVPPALLLKLRAARASGDADLFEDIAHEIALSLVGD